MKFIVTPEIFEKLPNMYVGSWLLMGLIIKRLTRKLRRCWKSTKSLRKISLLVLM